MLRCPACRRRYASGPDEPWRCDCGHALEFDVPTSPEGPPPDPGRLDRDDGLRAFGALLPVSPRVSLGEGWTPLVERSEWGVRAKLEYLSPTGSFKDRGAATTLSRAVDLGVERVVEDSSGNAGGAIAAYAARADIAAEIFVPASIPPAKRAAIERTGADIRPIEGDRTAVETAAQARIEADDAWYASHAWNPAFYAGTMTCGLEIAAQRAWSAPDAIVLPVGHGTLLLGLYRAFDVLNEAGWTEAMPRLLAVQAAGHSPLADRLHGPSAGENALAISLSTIASTGSAINATLFSGSHFAKRLVALAGVAAGISMLGSLEAITAFASLAFILVFGGVSAIAVGQRSREGVTGWPPALGALGSAVFLGLMLWHLQRAEPETFWAVLGLAIAVVGVELLYFEREALERQVEELEPDLSTDH